MERASQKGHPLCEREGLEFSLLIDDHLSLERMFRSYRFALGMTGTMIVPNSDNFGRIERSPQRFQMAHGLNTGNLKGHRSRMAEKYTDVSF